MTRRLQRGLGPVAGTLLVVAAVLGTTWPLPLHFSTHIPADIDALFGAWRLAWVAESLRHSPASLFDAPIFHPHRLTLAYSDSILLSGALTAPFAYLKASPVSVFNIFVLFAVATAGLAAMYLAYTLTGSWAAGALAGIIYSLNPHRMEHLARIELLTTAAVPAFFVLWHRAAATHSRFLGILAGTALFAQWYSGMYIGLFLACVAPLVLLDLLWVDRTARFRLASALLGGMLISAVVIGASVPPYLEARAELGERGLVEVSRYSAELRNFIAVHPRNWLYGGVLSGYGSAERYLFPGLAASLLGLAGLLFSGWRIRVVYVAIGLAALLLALGTNTPVFDVVRERVSPFRSIRAPARAADIVMLAIAVFAAVGFARLFQSARSNSTAVLAAALACVLVAEYRMVPNVWAVKPSDPMLARSLGIDKGSVLLEFPVARPDRLDINYDAHYMFDRVLLWPRLINGYSGNYPGGYIRLLENLRTFPDDRSLAAAIAAGADHIVLHEKWMPSAYGETLLKVSAAPQLSPVGVYSEPGGQVAVFKVVARRPQ